MANIPFDGDFKDISEKQLKYISDVLIERGFRNKVSVQSVGGVGETMWLMLKDLQLKEMVKFSRWWRK